MGGLDLTSRAFALKGGESGAALLPKDAAHSPIFLLTSSGKMPPGNPLSRAELETLKAWIDSGASWEQITPAAPKRAGLDWWSLQPIRLPKVPITKNQAWVRNPIDAFVLSVLEAQGISPAPSADKRTLIRRASFDLLGLPPTPQEVAFFLADKSPNAYEKLIDRLLASPHYGERWGRHWLDVARFGESMGYEYDHLRDYAWRYRDYVIGAFNSDRPYPQFLREQIAGDVLPNAGTNGVIASGFLVAGPMDEAGKGAAGLLVRLRAREEEMEDIIGLVGQTCLGLTINCSRCHDHKFDPITQKDYYRLKSALMGVNPGNRPALDEATRQARDARIALLKSQYTECQTAIASIVQSVRAQLIQKRTAVPVSNAPRPFAQWTFEQDVSDSLAGLQGELTGGATVSGGRLHLNGTTAKMQTTSLPKAIKEKTLETWITLTDLNQRGGTALTLETEGGGQFDGIVYGEREPGKWISGSENFIRTKDLEATKETAAPNTLIQIAIVYHADNRIEIYRNGKPYAPAYLPSGSNGTLRTYPAGKAHLLFGQRHTGAGNFLHGEIEEARLYDRALSAKEIATAYQALPANIPLSELAQALPPQQKQEFKRLRTEAERINTELAALEKPLMTYGVISGQPEPTHILLRGDVQSQGELVAPGGIAALRTCTADWGLSPSAPEAKRRINLAEWLTDAHNPLTARVMANRVWQYHFGQGIVGTPNDFGYNGERPSHPALLDWLASAFKSPRMGKTSGGNPYACDWRLKSLHRLIMLSNTYRQSDQYNAKAAGRDADNRLLWRYAPRRMEAETIRDTMLAVSGQLNPLMGGESFRPFTVENFGSSFYRLTDSPSPEFNRRTIYRMTVHSARSPLLESLDCPDPSTKTPKRTATVTPIQALELMNDPFVLRQAVAFAARVKGMVGTDSANQITAAYTLAYGREPTAAELKRGLAYLKTKRLDSLCWAIFNSSEFLYVR